MRTLRVMDIWARATPAILMRTQTASLRTKGRSWMTTFIGTRDTAHCN